MECDGCGSDKATIVRAKFQDKVKIEYCDQCSDIVSGRGVPDVYFREAGWVSTLASDSDPSTWDRGSYVTSRRHKAELLKKFGLRESGDRVHGSNNFDPIAHRHARESLRRNK